MNNQSTVTESVVSLEPTPTAAKASTAKHGKLEKYVASGSQPNATTNGKTTEKANTVEAVPALANLVKIDSAVMLSAYSAIDSEESKIKFQLAYYSELKDSRVIDALERESGKKAASFNQSVSVAELTLNQVQAALYRELSGDLSAMTVAALTDKRNRLKTEALTSIHELATNRMFARVRNLIGELANKGIQVRLSDLVGKDSPKAFCFVKGGAINVVRVSDSFKATSLDINGNIYVRSLAVADVSVEGLVKTVKKAYSLSDTDVIEFNGLNIGKALDNIDKNGNVVAFLDINKAFNALTNKAIDTAYNAYPALKNGLAELIAQGADKAALEQFVADNAIRFGYAVKGAKAAIKQAVKSTK